jgi:hypothetical protein
VLKTPFPKLSLDLTGTYLFIHRFIHQIKDRFEVLIGGFLHRHFAGSGGGIIAIRWL